MKIPFVYNARSVLQRPASTAFTAAGIGLVVAVFIGLLALADGFRAGVAGTGSDEDAVVLRRGADAELSSGLDRETANLIGASPRVAVGGDGGPLVSAEACVLIPLVRLGGDSNSIGNV